MPSMIACFKSPTRRCVFDVTLLLQSGVPTKKLGTGKGAWHYSVIKSETIPVQTLS